MRRITCFAVAALVNVACDQPLEPARLALPLSASTSNVAPDACAPARQITMSLRSAQGDVGIVHVWNDDSKMYVSLRATGGWEWQETHVAVVSSYADFPTSDAGYPIVGQFPFKREHKPPVTEDTYILELTSLSGPVMLATHVTARSPHNGASESGWAGDIAFHGPRTDARYFVYSSLGAYSGDLVINSQAQLEAASQYASVSGNLTVRFNDISEPAEIDELRCLQHVGGSLTIAGERLDNVDGLAQLNSVGGDLLLSRVFRVRHLDGLSALRTVGGNVSISAIWQNFTHPPFQLADASGLSSLQSIGGSFTLAGAENLTSLTLSLERIPGNFTLCHSGLRNLDGLTALNEIGGSLEIRGNWHLADISGLRNLTNVGHSVLIVPCPAAARFFVTTHNAALLSLSGLSGLQSIPKHLIIRQNTTLRDLSGLDHLVRVGGALQLVLNPALTDLDPLDKLRALGGSLLIHENTSLHSVSGLSRLEAVPGDFTITYNPRLLDVNAERLRDAIGVDNIGGRITIRGNGKPGDFLGDYAIATPGDIAALAGFTGISGTLTITSSPPDALSSLAGLEGLTTIARDLIIFGNGALMNLDGLAGLTKVDRTLVVAKNAALVNVDGLARIAAVENVAIARNPALRSMNALAATEHVPGLIQIVTSPLLRDVAGLDALLTAGSIVIMGGSEWTEFRSLSRLQSLTGDLSLTGLFSNLEGLSSLTSVGRDLELRDLTRLESFQGLRSLQRVGRDFEIDLIDVFGQRAPVTSPTGLSGLTRIEGRFTLGSTFTSLDGLQALQHVGSFLLGNSALQSLAGLSGLTSIASGLTISSTGLRAVDFPALQASQLENIDISSNSSLRHLGGLASLATVQGQLRILSNPQLSNLEGLANVSHVAGWLQIDGAPVTDLTGLRALASVAGDLSITNNWMLNSLNGLENLRTIGGTFGVFNNQTLRSVQAAGGIESIGGGLNISNNWQLPAASAYALRDAIGMSNIAGAIVISCSDFRCVEKY